MVNVIKVFEPLDLNVPPIPPRSRLYCLKPIGIGTPYVESLSSYFVRLANAHCVQPKKLAYQEILPLAKGIDQNSLAADKCNSWFKSSDTMNGANSSTIKWVNALEQLTHRSDLQFLTMLTWRNVTHTKDLVKKNKAWCSSCYKEWRETGQAIYEPLIWCLKDVVDCPHHQQRLFQQCSNENCQKPISLLADWSQPGFCPYCQCFLDTKPITESLEINVGNSNNTEWNRWVNDQISELVAISPNLSTLPSIDDLALKISLRSRAEMKLDNVNLAKNLGISASNLIGWQQGLHTMSFDILLKLCSLLLVSPAQLLMSIEDSKNLENWNLFETNHYSLDIEKLRESLQVFLESSTKPVSLKIAAKQLGYSPGFLQYYCPDLCSDITKKYASRQKITRLTERNLLQQELEYILESNSNTPPSLMEIARRLNCPISLLQRHFPHLCKEITNRRRRFGKGVNSQQKPINSFSMESKALTMPKHSNNPQHQNQHGNLSNLNQQKKALDEALLSNEPIPLKAIAKSLRCHTRVLRTHFPELCRVIEKRYEGSFDAEKVKIALEGALERNNRPPSIIAIAKTLGYPEKILELYCPELCALLLERRLQRLDISDLKMNLEAILASDKEPISINEISKRLGYSSQTIFNRFPELYTAISHKYQTFRQKRKQERIEKLCQAVKQATIIIHERGERPGETQVRTMIGNSIHFIIPEVRAAWHQTMEELGYEV